MSNQRLTSAELRLIKEQSSLGQTGIDGRLLLVMLTCATLGGLALVIWGAKLAISGIALLPGM